MHFDHDRLTMLFASLAGSAVWGMWHLVALLQAGTPPALADWLKAGLNIACGVVAGGLMAYALGPAIAGLIPWAPLKDASAIGFVIGCAAWEALPLLQNIVKKHLGKLGE